MTQLGSNPHLSTFHASAIHIYPSLCFTFPFASRDSSQRNPGGVGQMGEENFAKAKNMSDALELRVYVHYKQHAK